MSDENQEPVLDQVHQVHQINCNVGSLNDANATKKEALLVRSDSGTSCGTKPKRKSKAARRRLHAMMSNVSLHFSDTDSEGELAIINTQKNSLSPSKSPRKNPVAPIISVTLENSESEPVEMNWDGLNNFPRSPRRNSFVDNLTDVDEILVGSDVETPTVENKGLAVFENDIQGETDMEDVSNDEEDHDEPIYVRPRMDILRELSGGTITTKEGDGPFSVEVRNQMSFDEDDARDFPHGCLTDELVIYGGTDSEEMNASDEDEGLDEACGQRSLMEEFDFLAASQVEMTNVQKSNDLLSVREPTDDGSYDGHTDIEDVD
ncbi:uncharacterized protein [Chelonus insularis]|uniref:uncharacterized protein n=1 Tax=Chelonus insularis TaxID=460826 RepID=UPI00158B5E4D|nr:uncharacterized protein LOC118074199 [Chelonus insularis]